MIRVGVVGASGWAAGSHLPALAALPEFEVTAVATTKQASAGKAAAGHNVPHAFTDANTLAAHPSVDLVVVSVKAPEHSKVIRAALKAGKHVLSEWPLTADPDEAPDLAEAATAAGVLHAVSLQGTHSPDARFVADLINGGRIGRLESAVLVASGAPYGGGSIYPDLAWCADPAGGATILTIMAGHFIATLERMTGSLAEVSARLPRLYDQLTLEGTSRTIPNQTPSHVLVHGTLENGATASITVHGASGSPDGFLVKLVGSEGTIVITPPQPGTYMHWTDWDIRVNNEPTKVPDAYVTVPFDPSAGPVANVAAVYQEFARALTENRQPTPNFHTAARLHHLLTTIEEAARTGNPEEVRPRR
ncbi:Gfo/Idh/MocA family protein [Actinomadura rugatobispora]|uniref:Gfo/Idh/MocA family protein n=1 Tax=Actinomadura rugatobispora TaxID=1994 RepID=A0ABW1A1N4_9ACTN|nr:Gfo/Idh/MocA family oxidoreductase [Actinomadura rugatobispora]